jgi:hypothetical protein
LKRAIDLFSSGLDIVHRTSLGCAAQKIDRVTDRWQMPYGLGSCTEQIGRFF